MDTMIAATVRSQRKKKWFLILFIVIAAVAGIVLLLRSFLAPAVKRSEITIAVVERGDMEHTLSASGEVLPEFEEVISSPIHAAIQAVMLDAGSTVSAGQSIMTLDKSIATAEYSKLRFQLASKRNAIKKLQLELDKSFYDIKSNNEVKRLRIHALEATVAQAQHLFKAGGGTRADIEQASLNLEVARLEKQQLENEIRNKQQTMQIEMREAGIAASIQENDLQELGRKLQLADIAASRAGVVTWANRNIGTMVQEGDALVRIADLRSFKVRGTIADQYLDQLQTGMAAIIRMNETTIRATVVNVQPAVQNGLVTFDLQLEVRQHKLLRPNMKVDVFLVITSKRDVLRVANGPAFRGPAALDVFVVKDGHAERRSVHTGLRNFDHIELMPPVRAGDSVIISDMSDFKHARTIVITK